MVGEKVRNSTMDTTKLDCLVADSAAFLKNVDMQNLAHRIFTVKEVINEIRDAATKQRLAVLPYEIYFREPSTESLSFGMARLNLIYLHSILSFD